MESLDKNRVEKIPEKIYNRESDRLADIVIKLLKQLNYKILRYLKREQRVLFILERDVIKSNEYRGENKEK